MLRKLALKGFFFSSFFWYLNLENCLNNLLKVFFNIISNIICKNFESLANSLNRDLFRDLFDLKRFFCSNMIDKRPVGVSEIFFF